MSVSFAVSRTEARLISKITGRAIELAERHSIDVEFLDLEMDLTACHCNGCQLQLEELLAADDDDFGHDVFGIRRYIDRDTGELTRCFLPRYAAPEGGAA